MTGVLVTAAAAASVLALSLLATEPNAQAAAGGTAPTLHSQTNCGIGPVEKSYAGTPWLVYGCNDGHSIEMAGASGSRVEGFFITFQWNNGAYRPEMSNRGGSDRLTEAYPAFRAVSAFSVSDIDALYAEAKLASSAPDTRLCRNAFGKSIKCRRL
jgi:hypothetical protein